MGATARTDCADIETRFESHRAELTAYCYRMLGSGFEAEDAVQETLIRAWRGIDRFEGRSTLRAWLYSIATNVCLNMLKGAQRRARPMDLGPASSGDAPLGPALAERTWLGPIPDRRVLPADGDPAELAVARESIRLAFVAALQLLPPRQRAVLILRDVLRWSAADVAELLETNVVSVKSALQRARATLATSGMAGSDRWTPSVPMDGEHQALLDRYVDALERWDIDALVALLHEDATLAMPPHALWLQGAAEHPPLVPEQAPRAACAPDGGQRLVRARRLPDPPAGRRLRAIPPAGRRGLSWADHRDPLVPRPQPRVSSCRWGRTRRCRPVPPLRPARPTRRVTRRRTAGRSRVAPPGRARPAGRRTRAAPGSHPRSAAP